MEYENREGFELEVNSATIRLYYRWERFPPVSLSLKVLLF